MDTCFRFHLSVPNASCTAPQGTEHSAAGLSSATWNRHTKCQWILFHLGILRICFHEWKDLLRMNKWMLSRPPRTLCSVCVYSDMAKVPLASTIVIPLPTQQPRKSAAINDHHHHQRDALQCKRWRLAWQQVWPTLLLSQHSTDRGLVLESMEQRWLWDVAVVFTKSIKGWFRQVICVVFESWPCDFLSFLMTNLRVLKLGSE